MTKVMVGIIVDASGRVLLCQRTSDKPYPLKWEFPGGKVQDGESTEACLRRELEEELGIHATVGDLYHRQRAVYADSGSFDVFYYRVPSFGGAMTNRVFADIRWVPMNELNRYDILEGNTEVVGKLIADYAKVESGKA